MYKNKIRREGHCCALLRIVALQQISPSLYCWITWEQRGPHDQEIYISHHINI
jgi:hypothetical protein